MFKSSIASASTTALLMLLIFAYESRRDVLSVNSFTGLVVAVAIFWVISFGISYICLFPLKKVFFKLNRKYSLSIFICLGIYIPLQVMYLLSFMPDHGHSGPLFKLTTSYILGSLLFSLVGGVSAASAWYVLFKLNKNKI